MSLQNAASNILSAIESLLEVSGSSWQEKRDAVLSEASEHDKINLDEFCSWFQKEEE